MMIVTTAGRTNPEMIMKAKQVATELKIPFVERRKASVESLQNALREDVLVVGKNRMEIRAIDSDAPLFFHPNSSMFRVKRILRGETEPFLQATKLTKGMTFLDCTLGLASDSIVASTVVGRSGRVVGLEANQYIAYLVKKGLHEWDSGVKEMNEAMRRIAVTNEDFRSFLLSAPDNTFDVVYIDPMFEESILESDGIQGIKRFAFYADIDEDIIMEAKRVARKRVVLKDHWKSERFHTFGFTVYVRKTAKFHFGVIEKE